MLQYILLDSQHAERDGFTDLLYLWNGDHTVKSKVSNTAHATLSRSLRQYLDHGLSNGSYIITPGELHIGDYLVRRPRGNVHRHPPLLDTQRRADLAMVNYHDNITTLDKLLQLGSSTREEPDRDFVTTSPNVNLVIFAVEDSGAVHPEVHQFLRNLARLVAPDNPGRKLGHSLASLSVSIQAARAKSVTTARDLLSIDALPPQPYTSDPPHSPSTRIAST